MDALRKAKCSTIKGLPSMPNAYSLAGALNFIVFINYLYQSLTRNPYHPLPPLPPEFLG